MPDEPVDRGRSPPAPLSLALAALVVATFLGVVLAVTSDAERAVAPAWAGAALPFGMVLILALLAGYVFLGWAYLLLTRGPSGR